MQEQIFSCAGFHFLLAPPDLHLPCVRESQSQCQEAVLLACQLRARAHSTLLYEKSTETSKMAAAVMLERAEAISSIDTEKGISIYKEIGT